MAKVNKKCPDHGGKVWVVYTKKGPVAKGGSESERKRWQEILDEKMSRHPEKYAALMKKQEKKGS